MKVVAIPLEEHQSVSHVVKGACQVVVPLIVVHVLLECIHCHHKDLVWTAKLPITAWEEYGSRVQWEWYPLRKLLLALPAQPVPTAVKIKSSHASVDINAVMGSNPFVQLAPTPWRDHHSALPVRLGPMLMRITLLVSTVRRGTTVLLESRSHVQKEPLQNPNKSTVLCAPVEVNVSIMSSPLAHRGTTASMERDPCAPWVPIPYKGMLPAQSAALDPTLPRREQLLVSHAQMGISVRMVS